MTLYFILNRLLIWVICFISSQWWPSAQSDTILRQTCSRSRSTSISCRGGSSSTEVASSCSPPTSTTSHPSRSSSAPSGTSRTRTTRSWASRSPVGEGLGGSQRPTFRRRYSQGRRGSSRGHTSAVRIHARRTPTFTLSDVEQLLPVSVCVSMKVTICRLFLYLKKNHNVQYNLI